MCRLVMDARSCRLGVVGTTGMPFSVFSRPSNTPTSEVILVGVLLYRHLT